MKSEEPVVGNSSALRSRLQYLAGNNGLRFATVTLSTSLPDPMPLCFEPWGDVIQLLPGECYVLVAEGPNELSDTFRDLDVHWESDCVSISYASL